MKNNTINFESLNLSGPARIRAQFYPKIQISLADAARALGMSYCRLFRRINEGKLRVKLRFDENDRRFILVDDLVDYLYPDKAQAQENRVPSKVKVGRPRKSIKGDV